VARRSSPIELKTILITGATDGIGLASAVELARPGHHILVHGRNPARGQQAVQEISRATGNSRVELLLADLTSLAAVRALAAQVTSKYPRLDILINNAGVFMPRRTLTSDGFEVTFAVNHLAHFLLTNLLLDLLKASAPARIIHVSSGTHRSGRVEWDNLMGERRYDGYAAYANSKLANVLFAYALADRLRATRVTSNALHPGVIATKLLRAGWGGGGRELSRGAETVVYAATAPELETVTGRYFSDGRQAASSAASHDQELERKLWETSAALVGLD
jgi:NAD(P)-dependent dehydrogenase (short-subunit alcohol dehydrogenase family)